jgi:hypothetical protein
VYLWMLRWGNMVLLTIKFLDVAKFTTLTPLSLLISCELSFPIVGLKISSYSLAEEVMLTQPRAVKYHDHYHSVYSNLFLRPTFVCNTDKVCFLEGRSRTITLLNY